MQNQQHGVMCPFRADVSLQCSLFTVHNLDPAILAFLAMIRLLSLAPMKPEAVERVESSF